MIEVKWTKLALEDNEQNIQYLYENWNNSVIDDYISSIENTIENIILFPKIGTYDDIIDCCKILVIPQLYLYYYIEENYLYILRIWNNYQRPISSQDFEYVP